MSQISEFVIRLVRLEICVSCFAMRVSGAVCRGEGLEGGGD